MYKKYQLSNGMNVILAQSKKSPVVSAQVWVRNGSADEQKGEEGVSHFIEHLLFKGTDKYGVGEIANRVEAAGGQLNAYTSFDQTVYYMTLSKDYMAEAVDMLSEMLCHPRFDKEEIDNEREVVIEEIKRGMDSPGRVASRTLFETSYKKHPYRRPVIGYEKVVKNISPKKIQAFFKERYSTKNMFFLLSGDFEDKEAKKVIEEKFGKVKPSKVPKRVRPKEEKQEKPRIKVQSADFENTFCFVSWPIPHVKHKDVPALDILSMILSYSDSSILTRKMRNEKRAANSISCSTFTPNGPGILTIKSSLSKEQIPAYYDELLASMLEAKEEMFSPEEIASSVSTLESLEFYSMETVDGMANKFGTYEFLLNDPGAFKEYFKEIRKVTPEDLIRVFKKYLKPEKISIGITSNYEEKTLKSLSRKFIKNYEAVYKEIAKVKVKKPKRIGKLPSFKADKSEKKAVKLNIAKGVDLIYLETYETPTISLDIAIEGGLISENQDNNGVFNLIGDCFLSGNQRMSEQELASVLHKENIHMGAFSGRNTYGVNLSCLSHKFAHALDIMIEQLREPKFEEQAIQRELSLSKNYLSTQNDRPAQIAHSALMAKMFKGHPYAMDVIGTEKSLQKLTREMCIQMHAESLLKRKIVISCVGAIDPKLLVSKFKEFFKSIKRDYQEKDFAVKDLKIDKTQRIESSLPKEQSHVFYTFKGLSYTDSDRYVLRVMESILSGQGGRLFMNLRDRASLAYTVSPMRFEGLGAGYFGAYIGCSPEKSEKAISMMKDEFDQLMNELVSEEELVNAKQNLIGKIDIQSQRNSSIANRMLFDEMYGMGFDERLKMRKKINSVTRSEIQALAKKIFSEKHLISIVHGQASKN